MAQESPNPQEVVLVEEKNHVRMITLNRPRQLNVISSKVVSLLAEYLEKWEKDEDAKLVIIKVSLLAEYLEKWEKDEDAKLVIIKGAGRAFSAGGDLKMFYDGRPTNDSCIEVVYRMYWLCYHNHTYKKSQVALVHGLVMGGGASLAVPMKFSVVTEKTVFAVPEASIGFHTDCSFSYILSRLPGHLGEFLALTGARLSGKEMVSAGLATHFVPSEKLVELEERLISLKMGDEQEIKSVIEEFSVEVQIDEESRIHGNNLLIINKCFSKESVEAIIESLKAEESNEGNGWIAALLKGLNKSSPIGLKITLRSVREGRNQTLSECLKKEFRLTMNLLRSVISGDLYEGIRAVNIDKDNAPKWDPPVLDQVTREKLDLVFEPFKEELELQIPAEGEAFRWDGKFETSAYKNSEGRKLKDDTS